MLDTCGSRKATLHFEFSTALFPRHDHCWPQGGAAPSAGAGTVLHQQFVTFVCNRSRVGN